MSQLFRQRTLFLLLTHQSIPKFIIPTARNVKAVLHQSQSPFSIKRIKHLLSLRQIRKRGNSLYKHAFHQRKKQLSISGHCQKVQSTNKSCVFEIRKILEEIFGLMKYMLSFPSNVAYVRSFQKPSLWHLGITFDIHVMIPGLLHQNARKEEARELLLQKAGEQDQNF